jgi:CRISPR-associated endonuclease Csn1
VAVSQDAKQAILRIKPTNFKSFGHLSVKALQKITPHIINGVTYDKACEAAGYDFRKKGANLEQITNPVVKRAITQTLKVVKAVERKYGAPYYIRVETARELAKNFKDRKAIENEQKENQGRNATLIEKIKEHGITNPTGMQIIKFKLYNEQHAKSLYSGTPIDLERLLYDDNAYQVDHIIPFSRSGNDSLTNKALVTTAENQEKGNKTPYEWLGGDESRWKEFTALVESIYKTMPVEKGDKNAKDNYKFNGYAFKKKGNLLAQSYTRSGWAESPRALNDTRYITKFVQNYLRQTVDFAKGERDNEQRVFAPSGTLTAYMRKRWGLAKDRSEDVLHHAKDAAVVAVMDQKMIYRANQYAKSTEMRQYLVNTKTLEEKAKLLVEATDKETGEIIDEDTFADIQADKKRAEHIKDTMEVLSEKYFPKPWPRFPEEVDWRTRPILTQELRDKMQNFDAYDAEFTEEIQPIFVSRMPNRKASGGAHKETLRSAKADDDDMRTVRTPLTNVKLKDLEGSPVKDTDPQLYQTLKERLEAHGDKPDKAFAEPVYKKDKQGNDVHEVRAIKVASKQPSGFHVNKGKAFVNNGSMVRLDIYQKQNAKGKVEHFFVPIYTHQIPLEKRGQKITKILPTPKGFTDVDDTFTKVTSLFPNDYVRFYFGNQVKEGYYVKYGINNGAIQLIDHHAPSKDKEFFIQVSGRSAVSIKRYDISILADNAPRP